MWRALSLTCVLLVSGGCAAGRYAVTPTEAHRLVQAGAVLLDVRSAAEFSDAHLPGAVNIPVGELAARVGELKGARAVVVYCHSGARAARAASVLEEAGLTAIANLGPMSAW
jgi:rhodanese-related sulfurtransferase